MVSTKARGVRHGLYQTVDKPGTTTTIAIRNKSKGNKNETCRDVPACRGLGRPTQSRWDRMGRKGQVRRTTLWRSSSTKRNFETQSIPLKNKGNLSMVIVRFVWNCRDDKSTQCLRRWKKITFLDSQVIDGREGVARVPLKFHRGMWFLLGQRPNRRKRDLDIPSNTERKFVPALAAKGPHEKRVFPCKESRWGIV